MLGDMTLKSWTNAARLGLPHVVLAFLVLISVVQWPYVANHVVKPHFILMFIFYWSIYRPTLVPAFLCFLMGVLMDVLGGIPLGINAFIFVLTHWVVRDQRRFLMGQPFVVTWAIFGVVALLVMGLQWLIMALVSGHWAFPVSEVLRTGITFMIFPLVSLLMISVHRLLPSAPYHSDGITTS